MSLTEVARLEYGKRCAHPGGPILRGADYRVLATSEGFPPSVLEGIVEGTWDWLLPGMSVAGAVRFLGVGVSVEGVLHRLAAWTTRLPDNPHDPTDPRSYLRARVVITRHTEISWGTLLGALRSEPLEGFAGDPKLPALPPRPISLAQVAESDIRRALYYVINGIQVVVEGADPEELMSLVDQVALVLPTSHRPLVSAGWGPATVACVFRGGAERPPGAALWHRGDGRWDKPARRDEVVAALPDLGGPGLAFHKAIEQLGLKMVGSFEAEPPAAPGGAVPWLRVRDGAAVHALRALGLEAPGWAALRALQQWLLGGGDEAPPAEALAALPPARMEEALRAAIPTHRARAERLWEELGHRRGSDWIDVVDDPRLALISSLARAEPSALPWEEASLWTAPLPPRAAEGLAARLAAELADPHRLITVMRAADEAPWLDELLKQHLGKVVIGAATGAAELRRTVARWAKGAEQAGAAEAGAALTPDSDDPAPQDAGSFEGDIREVLLRQWECDADLRVALLPWIRAYGVSLTDPVGRLVDDGWDEHTWTWQAVTTLLESTIPEGQAGASKISGPCTLEEAAAIVLLRVLASDAEHLARFNGLEAGQRNKASTWVGLWTPGIDALLGVDTSDRHRPSPAVAAAEAKLIPALPVLRSAFQRAQRPGAARTTAAAWLVRAVKADAPVPLAQLVRDLQGGTPPPRIERTEAEALAALLPHAPELLQTLPWDRLADGRHASLVRLAASVGALDGPVGVLQIRALITTRQGPRPRRAGPPPPAVTLQQIAHWIDNSPISLEDASQLDESLVVESGLWVAVSGWSARGGERSEHVRTWLRSAGVLADQLGALASLVDGALKDDGSHLIRAALTGAFVEILTSGPHAASHEDLRSAVDQGRIHDAEDLALRLAEETGSRNVRTQVVWIAARLARWAARLSAPHPPAPLH